MALRKMAPKTLTYVKLISLEQHSQVYHSARQLKKNNLSTAIFFEMKLSLTSVYTQQKSYQTSNQLKTIFGLNPNSNKFQI
jgi:hypothetical protein